MKMLYIFLVDTGHMISVDMKLALESVGQLKSEIAKHHGIPEDKQVLLISGGESLNPNDRVCSYSAGTDTNPIFLFSKSAIESAEPPYPCVDYGDDCDMKEQVEGCLNMPPTYHTVVSRAQLAQHFYDLAKNQRVSCERLVYDQHLQQQGWAAVVANLEDIASSFKNKVAHFESNFLQYLESRNYYVELLKSFSHDISTLSKIPVLPVLLRKQAETHLGSGEGISLLQWISSKDNQSSLEQITDHCINGLNKIDKNTFDNLHVDIQKALEAVDNSQMKEVKGLGERLMGLETLMCSAKRHETEQGDLAQAFHNNQNQAGKLGDPSILPDLCISHQRQLEMLLINHQNLRDIRRRCARAKKELSENLHSRLRWIMFVEKTICDVENRLMMYHDILKRLKKYLEVVEQIHLAPKVYLTAVAEVVRRRNFSRLFVQWSGNLSQQSLELHKKEIAARKTFNSQISNHFLQTLFPGMKDLPPPFAVQPPAVFDANLPNIEMEDIEKLRQLLPELANYLKIPLQSDMPTIFLNSNQSIIGGDVSLSRVLQTGSVTSPTFLEPLPQLIEAQELAAGDCFLEIDKEILSLASEASPSSESFECTDNEVLKFQMKSPIKKKRDDEAEDKVSQPNDTAREKETFSPIEEEHGGDSDTEEFEQVGDLPKDHSPSDLIKRDLDMNKSHLERVQDTMTSLQSIAWEISNQLKLDILQLRDQIIQGKEIFIEETANITMQLNSSLEKIQKQITSEKDQAIEEALERVKQEHESMMRHYQSQLELESQKLEDAQTQVEMYYNQVQYYSTLLDNTKLENESQLIQIKKELKEESNEIAKNLMLEHELELDNLREEWNRKLISKEETIKNLNEIIEKKDNEMHRLRNDKASLERVYTERFQQEREQFQKLMEERYREQENVAVCQALKRQEELHKEEFQRLQMQKEEFERQLEMKIIKSFEDSYEEKLQRYKEQLDKDYEEQLLIKQKQFEHEKQEALNKLQETLERTHKNEIESLRSRFKLAYSTTAMEHSSSESCLEKMQLESDSMQYNKCTMKKDPCIIKETRRQSGDNLPYLQEEMPMLEKIDITEMNQLLSDVIQREKEAVKEKEILEIKVAELHQKLMEMENKEISSKSTILKDESGVEDHTYELKMKLQKKETELEEMKQKLANYDAAINPQVPISTDKVSVLTCEIGDVVLLCFDEKHDNYMVFYLGPVLHFLHTECLETLGFKNVSDENRRTWALAEVIEKEYCLAKKPHNRYKVPVGTRFYRVKAKPWDKEMAIRRQHQRRSSSAGSRGAPVLDSPHSSASSGDAGYAGSSSSSTMSASVI
ncbi:RB1-inducible coiled-coil protein 1 isoform X2 [Centruroides vittatus]|uniref:RB1-inducible coiled-coil protein 1 isoform X2 n=1 Tax=Centruroides vittatus TaxID=120091 RepID=UPI00351012DA